MLCLPRLNVPERKTKYTAGLHKFKVRMCRTILKSGFKVVRAHFFSDDMDVRRMLFGKDTATHIAVWSRSIASTKTFVLRSKH